jgi:hypothetical protein
MPAQSQAKYWEWEKTALVHTSGSVKSEAAALPWPAIAIARTQASRYSVHLLAFGPRTPTLLADLGLRFAGSFFAKSIICPTVCAPAIIPAQKWWQTVLK